MGPTTLLPAALSGCSQCCLNLTSKEGQGVGLGEMPTSNLGAHQQASTAQPSDSTALGEGAPLAPHS